MTYFWKKSNCANACGSMESRIFVSQPTAVSVRYAKVIMTSRMQTWLRAAQRLSKDFRSTLLYESHTNRIHSTRSKRAPVAL